ncbi:MAG TPA: hypothetical protein VG936_05875 [Lacunisphaera sp.]|nr:hypothetical protein [Lacunisphaera sp.]
MPPPEPATAPAEKPKFSLKPKAAEPAPPPPAPVEAQPLPEDVPEHVSGDATAVAPATDTGAEGEPGEITAMRQASGAPFPPPPGNFPTPPGMAKNLADAEKTAKAARKIAGKPGARKRLMVFASLGVLLLVLAGGGYFAFLKFTAPPPPPPPRPKPVAKPKPAEPPPEEKKPEPVVEKPKPEPVAAVPEAKPVETKPAAPPTPPPPPPASAEFKRWAEDLRIMGVRSGTETRIFVGGTAYAPGDLINPQLGVTFVGYNADTRMLTFKDATGAIVEKRN